MTPDIHEIKRKLNTPLLKAEDFECFKCGNVPRHLMDLKRAEKGTGEYDLLKNLVDDSVYSFIHKGKRLYRHKRNCKKGV